MSGNLQICSTMVFEICKMLKYHSHMLSSNLNIKELDTDSENPIWASAPTLLWTSCLLKTNQWN